MSERLAQPYVRHTASNANKQALNAANQQGHERTLSLSSENDEKSDTEAEEGTLRIVINRSAGTKPRTMDKIVQPTLEVPIPHYRIGTPRFSTQGTPMLRSSAYSRNSDNVSSNFTASTSSKPKLLFPVRHSSYARDSRTRPVSDMPAHAGQVLAEAQARYTMDSASKPPGLDRGTRAPAEGAIFDDLIQMQDDPSVVRYSQRTGDIVAATPARIIAQISSASFMDYELVSDFFLTFRSYLSTTQVLDLLLARLRWAINRLEDDGRIIRIRTFAALRHWILNYFVDDFVVNRKLRVDFCDQINDMYRKVRQRNGGGTSDLKILQDLKRCWNGRCSLYWESDEFVIDSHQEADIVPGGMVGSRRSSLTRLHVPAKQPAHTGHEPLQESRPAMESWFDNPPQDLGQKSHVRQDSTAPIVEGPVSIGSEKSLQPISCSIPTKILRRSPRLPNGTKEPHPIPSASRRQLSPSAPVPNSELHNQASTNTYKQSGSFTDSLRERDSEHSSDQDFVFVLSHAGSLIRGNVIPPGSPYLDVVPKAHPPQEQSALDLNAIASANEGLGIHLSHSSGVKTLIGSIRRALSNRQPVNDLGSAEMIDLKTKPLQQARKSALPLNVARSNDALRAKTVAAPSRTHLRIDLLCAAILHSYQTAQADISHGEMDANNGPLEMSHLEESMAVPDQHAAQAAQDHEPPRRLVSQVTAQSGSIMIVDDTGLDTTRMSGALPVPTARRTDTFTSGALSSNTNAMMSLSQSTYLGVPSVPSASQRSSGVFARRRSNSLDTGMTKAGQGFTDTGHRYSRSLSHISNLRRSLFGHDKRHQSTTTVTTAIRRPASSDNGMMRREPGEGLGEISPEAGDQQYNTERESNIPGHTLRRRPGGDLRKIQNVHDLDTSSRRDSNESASSDSDSVGGSLVIMANRPKDANPVVRPRSANGRVSLINTHSSQHLRPSFEAAVSGFSAIPDDDDGGLEATLLKLEGRYEKKSPNSNSASPQYRQEEFDPQTGRRSEELNGLESEKAMKQDGHWPSPVAHAPHIATSLPTMRDPTSLQSGAGTSSRRSSIYGLPTESIDGSEESYNSVPLLERGKGDESAAEYTPPRYKPAISMPRPLSPHSRVEEGQTLSESSHPSIEIVEETASIKDIPKGSTMPMTERSPTAHSFLLDADENLSDLSSELSVDIINHSDVVARNPSPLLAAPGTALSGLEMPTHPLAHPPSPSFTLNRLATLQNVNPMTFQKPPLTPDPSPTQTQNPFSKAIDHPTSAKEEQDSAKPPSIIAASSGHLPWILAYDSELVAEQMTLVEKAALSEIDWSDLVNMRWDNSAPTMLNWVDFLSNANYKGIDLVITRFNIMVKWALSEIVLTQSIHERAQTIMKYIHIAAHARRLHNYATMLQITIALTSAECTRLRKTWELVHPPERSLLKNMEALVQPLRNFHDLRVEMETADLTEGCIPFVGMFVRFKFLPIVLTNLPQVFISTISRTMRRNRLRSRSHVATRLSSTSSDIAPRPRLSKVCSDSLMQAPSSIFLLWKVS